MRQDQQVTIYCPGYLAGAAWAHEAFVAYDAKKDGCLPSYFPGEEMIILEAALVAGDAIRLFENSEHRRNQHKMDQAKR